MQKKEKTGAFKIKNTYTADSEGQRKILINSVIAKLIAQAK